MDFAIVLGLFGYLFIAGAFQFDWLDDPVSASGASGNEADPGADPLGMESQPVDAFLQDDAHLQAENNPEDGETDGETDPPESRSADVAFSDTAPDPAQDQAQDQAWMEDAHANADQLPEMGAGLFDAALDLSGGAAHDVGADGAPMQLDSFTPGEEMLLIAMNEDAANGALDVQVVPSDDGQDGLVFVEQMLVAVLRNAPDASAEDILVTLSGTAV